ARRTETQLSAPAAREGRGGPASSCVILSWFSDVWPPARVRRQVCLREQQLATRAVISTRRDRSNPLLPAAESMAESNGLMGSQSSLAAIGGVTNITDRV